MQEKDLIKQIRKGNEQAFHCLYGLYFNKVANYAFKLLRSEEDARETAQDVFIKLWNMRTELMAEKPISALIFRITKFTSIDRIRKRETRVKTIQICEIPLVADNEADNELRGREMYTEYRKIINKLPEKRKRIFQMSRDENLSYKEIAARLNISVKTVEAQVRLALHQIRKSLKDYPSTLMWALTIIFYT